MTDTTFPFPAIGSVHLSNSITQHRSIMATEKLTVNCQAANLRGHSKGRAYDLITKVSSGDELVWESVSTYLRPGKGDPDASRESDLNLIAGTGTEWKLPADLGRKYATISGDYNPIHLYPLTAKALGFNRQIAHGMWTLARCVATFDNRLATSATVLVEFRKPVFLPSKVAFGSKISETGIEFSLTNPKTGAAHLLGKAF